MLAVQTSASTRAQASPVRDGFVRRTVTPSTPPQVSYGLTALGEGITEPLQALSDWIRDHAGDILTAQAVYERETA